MEPDKELEDAVAACAKILEQKCGRRPFMIFVSKANLKFENEDARNKGIVSGTVTYTYRAKPKLGKNSLSKLLIDSTRVALNQAEKKALEGAES